MRSNSISFYSTSFIEDKETSFVEFHAVCSDIAQLKQVIESRGDNEALKAVAPELKHIRAEEDPNDPESYAGQISNLISRLSSYYDIAYYYTDVLPKLPRHLFREDVVRFSEENLERVDQHCGFPIYGLDDTEAFRLGHSVNKVNRVARASKDIQGSILLSFVSTYDAVFSDFCKFLLKKNPVRYSGSNKTFTVSEILSLGSIDQIYDKIIEDEIETIMVSSHTEQMEFFEKNFHVDFIKTFVRWADYIEIFERRNLAAHGSLVVNERYQKNCKAAGGQTCAELGTRLEISHEYMLKAIDTLIEVFVLISFAVWRKRVAEEVDDAFSLVVNTSFNLLRDDHERLAQRITDYALTIQDNRCDMMTRHMIIMNNAIATRKLDGIEPCKKKLKAVDWSALSPLFKLCTAAVQSDVDSCVRHLEGAKIADNLDIVALREWPAFEWVRTEPIFVEEVIKIFGEPLVRPKTLITEEDRDNNSDDSSIAELS